MPPLVNAPFRFKTHHGILKNSILFFRSALVLGESRFDMMKSGMSVQGLSLADTVLASYRGAAERRTGRLPSARRGGRWEGDDGIYVCIALSTPKPQPSGTSPAAAVRAVVARPKPQPSRASPAAAVSAAWHNACSLRVRPCPDDVLASSGWSPGLQR